MAEQFSSRAVVSFFSGEDTENIGEVICEGSDNELGMEDIEDDSSESDFEPLEISCIF